MKWAEEELNSQILAEGLSPQALFTRIGINSGDMVVGNMGSESKMNYTVMGNAVNLAARLEGVNKHYKTSIIISELTKIKVGQAFLCRRLDRVRVAGIYKPVLIYELMNTADKASQEELLFLEAWEEAIKEFDRRCFSRARDLFKALGDRKPQDALSSLYMERCISFLENPPAPEWDGVFDFISK